MDEEKAVAAISGFSDEKFKTEYELPLCAAAQGESRRTGTAERSRQDLKLLSNDWLGARVEACFPIFDLTTACLGNVLFDIACCLMEINRVTIRGKVVNLAGGYH